MLELPMFASSLNPPAIRLLLKLTSLIFELDTIFAGNDPYIIFDSNAIVFKVGDMAGGNSHCSPFPAAKSDFRLGSSVSMHCGREPRTAFVGARNPLKLCSNTVPFQTVRRQLSLLLKPDMLNASRLFASHMLDGNDPEKQLFDMDSAFNDEPLLNSSLGIVPDK